MTSSHVAELTGSQVPRILWSPPRVADSGSAQDAIELATAAGLHLDPWQQLALRESLGEQLDGRWASFQVGLVVPRQNGKTVVLLARMLAGLFLFGEREITYCAHLFSTAQGVWKDLCELIQGAPFLHRRVKNYPGTHGSEGIELWNGAELKIRARTRNGGRGLSGDLLILDEALDLSETTINALMPTTRARANPQIWYVSSPPDIREHPHSLVLAAIRERGLKGGAPRLTYLEWSAPFDDPADPTIDPMDPQLWVVSNPALGLRVHPDHFVSEVEGMPARGFRVEILGIGAWPKPEEGANALDPDRWSDAAMAPADVEQVDPVAIAVDMPPDRRSVVITLACRLADGRVLGEVLADRDGTAWVMKALMAFIREWNPVAVGIDAFSAALMFRDKLLDKGIEPVITQTKELRDACGGLHDLLHEGQLAHLDDPILNDALAAAKRAPLAGGFKFVPTGAESISPLVGLSLATYLLQRFGTPPPPVLTPRRAAATTQTATASGDLMSAGF